MQKIKVVNMNNPRTDKPVANQYIIRTPDGEYFQSYDSTIAFRTWENEITLDEKKWDYSVTTNRYRNEFLCETTPVTRKKIAAGIYKTADLNGS